MSTTISDNLGPQQNLAKGTNVQVAIRCRPLNAEERKGGQPSVLTCEPEHFEVIQMSQNFPFALYSLLFL